MPLDDLVDQPTLAAALAAAGVGASAAEAAQLPRLAAAASEAIRRFCRRDFTQATYDETYRVAPPQRSVLLRQFPLVSVQRVCTGLTPAMEVWNEASDTYRATAALAATDGVPTGLTLVRWAAGQATTSTVGLGPSVRTVAQLAAAVVAVGSGWRASAVGDFGPWAAADFRPLQGPRPAKAPARASFSVHADDLPFEADDPRGVLYLGSADGAYNVAGADDRWGPGWPGDAADAAPYGGATGLRVVYTAGFATIPADLVQAAVETVKAAITRLRSDDALKSESDGAYSYELRDPATLVTLPPTVTHALAPHISYRA